jgi:hypothetical protein
MPDEISLRDLLYNEETRLVFLRNSLAGDRSDNSYYHRVLSRLKEIETELEPEPKYCDDTDLKQWFEEVGKWAADVAGKPRIQSDTIIYRLIRVSVKCLAGQTRISTVFLPDVFGRRPYERLLDQLHSDVKNATFNL